MQYSIELRRYFVALNPLKILSRPASIKERLRRLDDWHSVAMEVFDIQMWEVCGLIPRKLQHMLL